MQKITACLIVKNEKDHIRDALASLAGIDEIVVVDTGSTDETAEIARAYGATVFQDYTWADDFAAARNHAISKCTGDWIFSLDADETLEPGGVDKMRKVMESASPSQLHFSVVMTAQVNGQKHNLPRLFRNDGSVAWKGVAHETLSPAQRNLTDIGVTYGYSTAHKLDPDRMLRILRKLVDEAGEKPSSRDLYYLARERYYRRQYTEAISVFKRYLQQAHFAPEKADGYLYLARCLFFEQRGGEAREACLKAIQLNPDFGEALHFMANLHYEPVRSKWLKIAYAATNKDVLFTRPTPKKDKKPLDMTEFDIQCFKNTLLSYKNPAVLEWGSGNSTKYFTDFLRSQNVEYTWEAIEHHRGWYEAVKKWNLPGVEVCFAEQNSPEYFDRDGKYDVIFVDGRNRRKCVLQAKELLKEGGIVLLHDADREYYHSAFEGYHGTFLNHEKGAPRLWRGKLTEKTSIPKVIHQIWIGPKKPPLELINSWKEKNPSFTHILWDEEKIDALGLINRDAYDRYYADKYFNGCANIARVEILERFGGIYMDADSECLLSIENAPFLDWDIFSVYEADNFFVDGKRLIANGIIGCQPNHPSIIRYREELEKLPIIHPSWKMSGPLLWTAVMQRQSACLEPYTFLPVHHSGTKNKIGGPVYAHQLWGTSKNLYTD